MRTTNKSLGSGVGVIVFCVDARIAKGHKPTYRANELAMTAAQHLGDGDWAIEVLSSGDAKKKSSVTAYAIAIRVLAETDRLEEAHDLLQVIDEG